MADELERTTFDLPFPDFVQATCKWLTEFEWPAFNDYQLFTFVRALKGHPHCKAMRAEQAYAEVSALARKRRGIVVPDTELAGEDAMVAFHKMWEKVRFPMGTDPVVVACGLAGNGLVKTQKDRPGRYTTFLTVAALLQMQRREMPIMLPARKMAQHMGCQPMTISSWTGWAIEDAVMVRTKVHVFRSGGGSKAAEYVFGLHMWPTVLPKFADLLGVSTRAANLTWIREQFEFAKEEASESSDSEGTP